MVSNRTLLETVQELAKRIPDNESSAEKLEIQVSTMEHVMSTLSSRVTELSVGASASGSSEPGSGSSEQDPEGNSSSSQGLLSDVVERVESLEKLVQGVVDCRSSVQVFVTELEPLLADLLARTAGPEGVLAELYSEKDKCELRGLLEGVSGRMVALKGRLDGMKIRMDGLRLCMDGLKCGIDSLKGSVAGVGVKSE